MSDDTITPDEFFRLLKEAATRARRSKPAWLDTEDLTQAAQLAMLEAERKGRTVFVSSDVHRRNHTRQRLFGAMMDSIRKAWDGTRAHPVAPSEPLPEGDSGWHGGTAADDPRRTYQLKQAVERLGRKGTHNQQEVVLLIAAGYTEQEAAAIMGLSATRVSQLRGQARKIMSMWGDL